jgi:hypothetical protein
MHVEIPMFFEVTCMMSIPSFVLAGPQTDGLVASGDMLQVRALANEAGLPQELVREWQMYVDEEADVQGGQGGSTGTLFLRVRDALLRDMRRLNGIPGREQNVHYGLSACEDIATRAMRMPRNESDLRERRSSVEAFLKSLFKGIPSGLCQENTWNAAAEHVLDQELSVDPYLWLLIGTWDTQVQEHVEREWTFYSFHRLPTIAEGLGYARRHVSDDVPSEELDRRGAEACVRKVCALSRSTMYERIFSQRTRRLREEAQARGLSDATRRDDRTAPRDAIANRIEWHFLIFWNAILPARSLYGGGTTRGPPTQDPSFAQRETENVSVAANRKE